MIEYNYLVNNDDFYLCYMSNLKTTTIRTLHDDNKKALLNRYLTLLVDHGLPSGHPDFKIEVKINCMDDIVDLHIGSAYPFIGKFDLTVPFNEDCVLKCLNDYNLSFNGSRNTAPLSEFRKTRLLFSTETVNNTLLQYLDFIADDLSTFDLERIGYAITAHSDCCEIELWDAYPFVKKFIKFQLDLNKDFDSDEVVKQLNLFVGDQLKEKHANCFVLIDDGWKLLETIKILEHALFFDNELTSIYYQHSIFKNMNTFSFLHVDHQKSELSLEMASKHPLNLEIQISVYNLAFLFGKKNGCYENFTWLRTDNMEYDILMVRQFFIIYLEKALGYKITDLKREIQLIEMETI